MSYSQLYERVQEQRNGRVKTSWIRDQVIDLTHIRAVREQWTAVINPEVLRGFFIEGPMGAPVPLGENEALIVLARSLSKEMRRFVYAKELMHAFDSAEERTDTPEKFDLQAERFGDPAAPMSAQFYAEQKAVWRALGVLVTEKTRIETRESIVLGQATLEIAAAKFKLPVWVTRELLRSDFEDILQHIM